MRIGEIVREGEREVPGWVPDKQEPRPRVPAPEKAPSESEKAPETEKVPA